MVCVQFAFWGRLCCKVPIAVVVMVIELKEGLPLTLEIWWATLAEMIWV